MNPSHKRFPDRWIFTPRGPKMISPVITSSFLIGFPCTFYNHGRSNRLRHIPPLTSSFLTNVPLQNKIVAPSRISFSSSYRSFSNSPFYGSMLSKTETSSVEYPCDNVDDNASSSYFSFNNSTPPPILSTLTPIQRECVESDSRFTVIAGTPGSGKSHCLIARAAYLMYDKNIWSKKIGSVHFTTKSQLWVQHLMDVHLPLSADTSNCHTFHYFIFFLLRGYLEKSLPEPVSYVERKVFITENWEKLKLHNVDVPSGNSTSIQVFQVSKFFEEMTHQDIPPEKFSKLVKKLNNNYWKKNMYEALAISYKLYVELLHKNHLYTEEDYIHLTIELLKDDTMGGFREFVKETYSHILIDEMEDITDLQYRCLLSLMGIPDKNSDEQDPETTKRVRKHIRHVMGEKYLNFAKNIENEEIKFGDSNTPGDYYTNTRHPIEAATLCCCENLALYRWKGTVPDIRQKLIKFPDCQVTLLLDNHRSNAAILEASQNLIRNNFDNKNIVPRGKSLVNEDLEGVNGVKMGVNVLSFKDKEAEADGVLRIVNALLASADYRKPIPFNNIAKRMRSFLYESGIKSVPRSQNERMAWCPIANSLVSWLSTVIDHNNEKELFEVVKSPIYNYPDESKIKLAEKVFSYNANDKYSSTRQYLRDLILQDSRNNYGSELAKLTAKAANNIKEDLSYARGMLRRSRSATASELLEYIITKRGLVRPFSVAGVNDYDSEERQENIESVEELCRLVKHEEEKSSYGSRDTESVINRIRLLRDYGETGYRFRVYSEEKSHNNQVEVFTYWSVKNMEFDYVLVTSALDSFLEDSHYFKINVPKGISSQTPWSRRELVREKRRLFYMCLTRAKKMCLFTYPENRSTRFGGVIKCSHSKFISECTANVDFTKIT